MNLITKLPGPIIIFLGAFSLSFGGLIVKSFEGASLWQILFWRSLFFSLTVLTFLLISYKKKTFKAFKDSGLPGFFGGIILFFDIIFFLTSADSIGFFGGIINSFENEYEPKINRKIKINLINILKKIIFL